MSGPLAALGGFLWAAAMLAGLAAFRFLALGRHREWARYGALTFALSALLGVVERDWSVAAFCAGIAILLLLWDWWNGGGRKAARQVGDKSRALLAAVIEKAREAGSPLPAPRGAGA